MILSANQEFLFFGKDDNAFLENYSYDLLKDYGEKSGQLFVTLEVQNNLKDAEEIGRAIFETMKGEFFADMEIDPYERFEVALKAVNKALLSFKKQKESGYIGNLSVIVAAVVGDTLYLSQYGEAEAYLVRKRYVSVVSEGLADGDGKSDETFVNIANGKIEAGDSVLFASTRLLRYLSKTDLAKCLSKSDLNSALSEVRDSVSTEMLGRVALTGISFEKATEAEKQLVEETADNVTKSILEASEGVSEKERETLSGRFFTIFKKKKERTEVFQGGGSFFSKISSFFSGLFSKGFGKDKILMVLVAVIVILAVGIFVVKGNTAEQEEISRLDTILISIQEKISEADTKSAYDKETAKTILDKAYNESMEVLNSGYYRQKAQTFLLQIEETRDKLDGVKRVENPKVYVDLSEKRADVSARGFVNVADRFFVFEYNALYEIVLDQLQDPLTIDDEEQVIAATGFDDRGSIVFMTQSGKLIEYRDGAVTFMDTDDGSFRTGVSLDDWSNRVYLLDTTEGQIWRYTYKGTSNKFGAAEAYVSDSTDLTGTKDLAIDSNVYVLKNDGTILKLYGGQNANLTIQNAPFASIKTPTAIYTNEKLNEIYVLDSGESRVFVYLKDQKTGNIAYQAQYLLEGVDDIRDLYVNPETKKMYLLTGSKVLEVDL